MKKLLIFVLSLSLGFLAYAGATRILKQIDVLEVIGQGSAPSNPAAGSFRFYERGGLFRFINSSGTELDIVTNVLTTKGDIFVSDGTDLERIAVGSNDQVLTADSTLDQGIKWAAAGGGANVVNISAGETINIGSVHLTGSCAITSESGDWIASTADPSTGRCDITLEAAFCATETTLVCFATGRSSGAVYVSSTATSADPPVVSTFVRIEAVGLSDQSHHLFCTCR